MGFGDSTAKKMRSRPVQVVAVSLMAIACIHVDCANTAEVARPIAVSASSPGPIEPFKLYVNPGLGDDQTGDGSRDRPFQTITHALDRARPNTIVTLAPGTYSEASGEQFPIQLRSGVTVYGDPESWGEDIEIVGGGWLMTPTAGEQSVAILGFDGAGLSGVTVSNPDGSAIWVAGGMPWIVGNTIAENDRHGIVAHDGTPYILNNRFDDNEGSDLELSDRATPQLQDNQLDRRNARSIGYFVTETGQTIAAANPSSPSSPPSPSPAVPLTRPIAQPQRPEPAESVAPTEIVTWQGETSFPPIVRPSETIATRPVTRPAIEFDPRAAQSLPLDPDLASALGASRDYSTGNRANTVRSDGDLERAIAPPERIPAIVRVPFEPTTSSSTTPIVPPATSSTPVRSSNQRLPAAPNVPSTSSEVNSPPIEVTSSEVTSSEVTSGTTNRSATVSIVTWGMPNNSSTGTPSTTIATPATPDTLLRWEALERSAPIASNQLPAPIVNPIGSPAASNSGSNLNSSSNLSSNTRPEPIVIAGQSAESIETNSANSRTRVPTPIQASIEPFDRANLPLAYAPSNVAPTWPQPRPTSIPGFLPLPVPDPNPPIGEGGALPPPPSSTVSLSDVPLGLVPVTTRSGVRYRVLVDLSAGVERVQAITGSAFTTQSDGRDVIQAGVFGDRWRADQLVADLVEEGLTAWIVEF